MKHVCIDVLSVAGDFREWVYGDLSGRESGLGGSCGMPAKGSSVPVFSTGRGGRLWKGAGGEGSGLEWQVLILPSALKWQTEAPESCCLCPSCLQTVDI